MTRDDRRAARARRPGGSGMRKPRPFECMECGKKMTLGQAERAVYGDGCPRCGGADVDEASS